MASAIALTACLGALAAPAYADEAAAKRWIDTEFQPSTLSKDEQMKEMQWFINAAKPFVGMEISIVSETITTHEYESKVLAKAFTEITGIKVKHDIIQEGDVVEKIQTQMQSGRNIYDGWINDSDLIGTHFRYNQTVSLTDFMAGEGKDVTLPTLDVDDFIGRSFGTAPDGKLFQLPDQQFANLYWFRYDWFTNPDYKAQFKAKYGYELGVPVNWSAYEDIAEFFTNDVKEIDGVKVYGHMDYGKKDPSLGWRFTDAWLSMAGNGDKGIPNGKPVDEWGIRMEGCRPVGSSVERGGDTNGPAAVYSIVKYVDWLNKYAPPNARGMTFSEAGRGAGPRQHRPADLLVHRLHRRHGEARPAGGERRRHAEMADGALAARLVLEGGHEARLPGRGLAHAPEVDAARPAQGCLALPAVHGRQDDIAEEEPCRPDLRPRKRHLGQELHRTGAEARRPDRVLPLAGARAVDPDRRQRARLSEAGAAVVAEHRRRLVRCQDAAGGDGCAGRRAGLGARAPREVRRAGRLRTQAQPQADGRVLVSPRSRRTAPSRRSASWRTRSPRARRSTTTR